MIRPVLFPILMLSFAFSGSFAFSRSKVVSLQPEHELFEIAKNFARKGQITDGDIRQVHVVALKYVDRHGRATDELQQVILQLEARYRSLFTPKAAAAFQTLVATVGASMAGPKQVPEHNVPYWLKDPGPLDHFRSSRDLPRDVDYLVIGAGLTGSSAALNLIEEAKKGKDVVVLEMGPQPASGASGRNGGNIEMIKENFLSDYRGFVEVQKEILQTRYPELSEEAARARAEIQSRYLLQFFQANVREIQKVIRENKINADASFEGWLRIADSPEEEKGLAEEIAFAKKLGLNFTIWSPQQIFEKTKIRTPYHGRFIQESGNYHPFKYVNETLQVALRNGVKLYTETKVARLEKQADGSYLVHTNGGKIRAKKVIVATNAYTRALFPDMTYIEPRVSHISNFNHVEDHFAGMTITMKKGDWYGNFPKQDRYVDDKGVPRGTLHVGGGFDTPIPADQVMNPPFITEVFDQVRGETATVVEDTAEKPPISAWSGVMAFTGDRAPILSFYYRDGRIDNSLIFAVAFNGYGGSQSAISGKVAAEMALTGRTPEAIPDELFSMRRFLQKEPLFRAAGPVCRGLFTR